MKITTIAICGESDHPLVGQFYDHYSKLSDEVIIQFGVTQKWMVANGDTVGLNKIYPGKMEQQNAALSRVKKDTDYVFYFDVDEFLPSSSIAEIRELLYSGPEVINFQMNHFWKDQNYIGVGGDGWGYNAWCPRIFKYHRGMYYSSHRPPTLMVNGSKLQTDHPVNFSTKINHYSYVYRDSIIRKLKYYNLIYPQFDYMVWFRNMWELWTPENRIELERKYSTHPSCAGATSELYTGKHEIKWL